MRKILFYFHTYLKFFGIFLAIGFNASCMELTKDYDNTDADTKTDADTSDTSVSASSGVWETNLEDCVLSEDSADGSDNAIYVAQRNDTGTEDGTTAYPYLTITQALTERRTRSSGTVYIYVDSEDTIVYEENLELNNSATDNNTYFVGCGYYIFNTAIEAADESSSDQSTITISGVDNVQFFNFEFQGIYDGYSTTSSFSTLSDDSNAATISIDNSTNIGFSTSIISDNYYQAIKVTGSGSSLQLDTVEITEPHDSPYYNNSIGVYMDTNTNLTANNIQITYFDRGIVNYGAAITVTADNSSYYIMTEADPSAYGYSSVYRDDDGDGVYTLNSHADLNEDAVAIYLLDTDVDGDDDLADADGDGDEDDADDQTERDDDNVEPTASISDIKVSGHYLGIYALNPGSLTLNNVSHYNDVDLRVCGEDATVSDNLVSVTGSISNGGVTCVGDVTISGSSNTFTDLTVDSDASASGDFSSTSGLVTSTDQVNCKSLDVTSNPISKFTCDY